MLFKVAPAKVNHGHTFTTLLKIKHKRVLKKCINVRFTVQGVSHFYLIRDPLLLLPPTLPGLGLQVLGCCVAQAAWATAALSLSPLHFFLIKIPENPGCWKYPLQALSTGMCSVLLFPGLSDWWRSVLKRWQPYLLRTQLLCPLFPSTCFFSLQNFWHRYLYMEMIPRKLRDWNLSPYLLPCGCWQ